MFKRKMTKMVIDLLHRMTLILTLNIQTRCDDMPVNDGIKQLYFLVDFYVLDFYVLDSDIF